MREVMKSSQMMDEPPTKKPKHDFPWDSLEIGYSFRVELDEIKLGTLRSIASVQGSKLGRTFRVIAHAHCYEVGRLNNPVHRSMTRTDGKAPWEPINIVGKTEAENLPNIVGTKESE